MPTTYLFDLDGTLYLGDRVVDGALDLLKFLEDRSIQPFCCTNNTSKSTKQLSEKLSRLGIPIAPGRVYGSGRATALFVKEMGHRTVYCIGTDGLKGELHDAGVQTCEDDSKGDALVVGLDTDFNATKLSGAVRVMNRGGAAIACNRDSRYPVENGKTLPACGSIVSAIEKASGKRIPWAVGKPNPYMLKLLGDDWKLKMEEILVIGDSYASDIAMARQCGCKSILISGRKYPGTLVVESVLQMRHIMGRQRKTKHLTSPGPTPV